MRALDRLDAYATHQGGFDYYFAHEGDDRMWDKARDDLLSIGMHDAARLLERARAKHEEYIRFMTETDWAVDSPDYMMDMRELDRQWRAFAPAVAEVLDRWRAESPSAEKTSTVKTGAGRTGGFGRRGINAASPRLHTARYGGGDDEGEGTKPSGVAGATARLTLSSVGFMALILLESALGLMTWRRRMREPGLPVNVLGMLFVMLVLGGMWMIGQHNKAVTSDRSAAANAGAASQFARP